MKRVQNDPDAKVVPAPPGIHGNALDGNGTHFANRIDRRTHVRVERWRSKPRFQSRSNFAAPGEVIWCCEQYTGRDVMKFH